MQESHPDNATNAGGIPSSIPVLGEGFSPTTPTDTTTPTTVSAQQLDSAEDPLIQENQDTTDSRLKKKLGQFGKKREEDKMESGTSTTQAAAVSPARSPSPFASGLRSGSPQPHTAMASLPSSPSRQLQSSPRLHSPAESQIFERNVQEDSAAAVTSPAIPSHIATEDHIPPVLDASSMAITDDHLTPDTVEIVTHTGHLPAAVAVSSSIHPESTLSSPVAEESSQLQDSMDDSGPSYAGLDSADIRRLSFISFADVVHAEQATDGSMSNSLYLSGGSSVASPGARSPSPIRSPISPLSSSITSAGDTSKILGTGPGSPKSLAVSLATTSTSPTVTGDIAIETMRQVLRKTGSGDLGAAARSSATAS